MQVLRCQLMHYKFTRTEAITSLELKLLRLFSYYVYFENRINSLKLKHIVTIIIEPCESTSKPYK